MALLIPVPVKTVQKVSLKIRNELMMHLIP
jgi:hypothetical protein